MQKFAKSLLSEQKIDSFLDEIEFFEEHSLCLN